MSVVALRACRRGIFLADQPASPGTRELETTTALDQAKRFADQAAIDAHVAFFGGTAGQWLGMTVP